MSLSDDTDGVDLFWCGSYEIDAGGDLSPSPGGKIKPDYFSADTEGFFFVDGKGGVPTPRT